MNLPFFYTDIIPDAASSLVLSEDTSKHIVQVLRMQNGESLQLTDGKGQLFTAEITDNNRKKCAVSIRQTSKIQPPSSKVTIAISPVKNTSRFEWFLEKATEIGVSSIIPLICERTEKQHFRFDRLQNILLSAMLQSRQCWLPGLLEPRRFEELVKEKAEGYGKYIAHCEVANEKAALPLQLAKSSHHLILIGPEGDFTPAEIQAALQNQFIPVSLGETRLRTETAGIVAATLLRLV
ncbi:MAG: 16S rRNA (uracil(1498)-N(3))-methyltransferase [Chitinophagaceae bacterium]|nr:16S rRNA (uracil(1498)-N(3))-methyltransferase [Chitinophagaceae bacterium]